MSHFDGKHEGKGPLGKPMHILENSIKKPYNMGLEEVD